MSTNKKADQVTVPSKQLDALMMRLESLEEQVQETRLLKTENEILKGQLSQVSGQRRQTQEEAFAQSREIIKASTAKALPASHKNRWKFVITPQGQTDGKGRQAKYAKPIVQMSKSRNKYEALRELQQRLDTNLDASNVKAFAANFEPEKEQPAAEAVEETLIEV